MSLLVEGDGRVDLITSIRHSAIEGVQKAVTWVAALVAADSRGGGPKNRLFHWLGRRDGFVIDARQHRRPLWLADEVLKVCFDGVQHFKNGQSLTVATALSLVCLACGRGPFSDVAVTGDMNLRGQLEDVEGLAAKLDGCKKTGISKLLLPASSLEKLRQSEDYAKMTPELKEYGDRVMIPVTSMIEVIHHMVFDCPPPIPDIVKGGLPPGGLVGLGFSVRFSDRASSSANSEERHMTMEAAVVCGGRKRTQEIIVTGGDTWADVFQHMGNMAITWVQHHAVNICNKLGLPADQSYHSLRARLKRDLVHVNMAGIRVKTTLYTVAMAIAIIHCLTGRAQRRDTAVVGDMVANDYFKAGPVGFTEKKHVDWLVEQGFRRVVVGDKKQLPDEVQAYLEEKRVEVLSAADHRFSLVEMLPLIMEGGEDGDT